ncbi:type III secretion system export apparatus subunit SctV [Simkania negevensis]|uniref:Type III secretion system export apparatus subunit SctV n=1 Tax=Simkania negevensis TaxID=83561 RepID=A0ABS3ATV4_9BACT|nr:type III secretion system export apparatus subunit SctV [Simkania negevensis]
MLRLISQSSDIVLALFVVAIVSFMVIPVPPPVIDVLIAMNLSIAFTLLMVALYIPSAVHLSIFPSLLLITTLFRLGINIASTKQILLHAYAGEIIQAFGLFVVGGSFVVGGVVFLIITVVQFIVITKGAERVAEVAARFTLDAMPGKQMSIDADMRAGVLDASEARQKRSAIQKESQLYGAMDGAMKFVKGDAIAGIVITLINVIGGLIIGMLIHKMPGMVAAKTYSLLSIGDGLVSQIPALLISITAGIVTTKVTSEDKDTNLGKEISGQLLRQPKALLVGAFVVLLLAFVPGFSKAPFIVIAILLGSVGYGFHAASKRAKAKRAGKGKAGIIDTDVDGHSVISAGEEEDFALTLPVILEVGTLVTKKISSKEADFIEAMIPRMRQALYNDLGIRFPGVHVRTNAPNIEKDEYNILLNEVPLIHGKIIESHVLTNEIEDNLKDYNIPYIEYINSLGLPSLWVAETHISILDKAGIKYWRPLEAIILHISYFFRHYAGEFLGIQEARSMLEFMERSYPDLIKEVTRLIPLQKLTEIFKRLVQEQVSVKDLRTIMEALSEWAQTEKDTVLLTEYVRSSLKRYISYKYSQGQTTLSVYLLDPEIEDMVRAAIKQTSAGSYLALDPDSVQMILQSVRNTIVPTPPGGQPPVLLTAIDVRRFVRKLIETEYPDVSVVSYQEIVPEIRIQPLGRIQIA